MSDIEILGWLGMGLLVLTVVVLLRRRRQTRRAKDLVVTPVTETITTRSHSGMWDTLTQREVEIVRMLIKNKRNADIAQALHISVYTVESHIKRIYTKLEVHNRLELVRKIHDLDE